MSVDNNTNQVQDLVERAQHYGETIGILKERERIATAVRDLAWRYKNAGNPAPLFDINEIANIIFEKEQA